MNRRDLRGTSGARTATYGQNAATKRPSGKRKAQAVAAVVALTWGLCLEPPVGIEPTTYSLRVNRSGRLS